MTGLGKHIDFVQTLSASTKRDYVQRVVQYDKAAGKLPDQSQGRPLPAAQKPPQLPSAPRTRALRRK